MNIKSRLRQAKKNIIAFLCAAAFTVSAVPSYAISSEAAYVMDASNGECYYELNAYTPLAPASMTKLMTVYIIYDKLRSGEISKNTMITADAEDAAASQDPDATNVDLTAGTAYSVDELLGAILVPSACAASAMVGKYLCGSEIAFASLMNSTAAQLGLDAFFDDASGLSDNDRISAYSAASLARILINDFPDILNYTSMPSISFHGKTYKSTNKLLAGGAYEYWGSDGLKTGTTTLAGYCLTSTAQRNGIRIIAVTMDSKSNPERYTDSTELLDMGFARAEFLYNNILATDMHIYINGAEVPAFYYGGSDKGLTFIIEDLKDYGFDIYWDEAEKIVKATYNSQKPVTPIPMDMYRAFPVGSALFAIEGNSGITAQIECGENAYEFKNVYSLNGYMAVSADELSSIADVCKWDEQTRSLNIIFE